MNDVDMQPAQLPLSQLPGGQLVITPPPHHYGWVATAPQDTAAGAATGDGRIRKHPVFMTEATVRTYANAVGCTRLEPLIADMMPKVIYALIKLMARDAIIKCNDNTGKSGTKRIQEGYKRKLCARDFISVLHRRGICVLPYYPQAPTPASTPAAPTTA